MKKIAVIFTSFGPLVHYFSRILEDNLPDCQLIRIADDSLIGDVKRLGKPDDGIEKRTFLHIESAITAGAQLVIIACSSVGAIAQSADRQFPVPVLRIDAAMMDQALRTGNRIGVIASLKTTIGPTVDFLKERASLAGKEPLIISRTAEGAYEALNKGSRTLHDELITKAALELAGDIDVLLLAQGSMAQLGHALSALLPIPVLTSPESCAEAVEALLQKEEPYESIYD